MSRALWAAATAGAAGFALFAVPGMRFGSLLLLCAGLSLAALDILGRLVPARRWARLCRGALAALLCVGLVCFAVLEALVVSGARGDAGGQEVSCVIVLGAGVNGTEPSLMLWSRLDAVLDYIADKPGVPIIVSGCQGSGEDISEAECMYRWLIAHGVEERRVWKEEQATSTRTNFAYSYALMRERGLDPSEPFAYVTNDFHMFRAGMVAGAPMARGVAARLPRAPYYAALEANYFVREAFALGNEYLLGMDLDL